MDKLELIELSKDPDLFISEMIKIVIKQDDNSELIKIISEAYNSGEILLIDILTKKTVENEKNGFYGRTQLIEKLLPELRLSLDDANRLTNFVAQNSIYLSSASFNKFEENLYNDNLGAKKAKAIVEWVISSPQERKNLIIPILISKKTSANEDLISYLIPLLNSKHAELIDKCFIFLDHNQIGEKEVLIKILEIIDNENLSDFKELAISALINFTKENLYTTTEVIDRLEINISKDSDFFTNCLFHKRSIIDEQLSDYLLNKVKSGVIISDKNTGILNSIIYNLIDNGNDDKTINFIESIGLRENNIPFLSKLSSIDHSIAQNEELFKKIVVKWFSEGNKKLFPLIDSIHKNMDDTNNYEFKIRKLETESLNQKQLELIIMRTSGWFFFHPKLALEFIILIYEKLDKKNREKSIQMIIDIFLSNYLSTTSECLKSRSESALAKDLETLITTRKDQTNKSWQVNELKHSASLINEFEINKRKEMEEVYKLAHKDSIFSQFVTPIHILYGNGSIYYTESINSPPIRQEMTMGTFEHSFEHPAMLVTDTTGLEIMLMNYKFGEQK